MLPVLWLQVDRCQIFLSGKWRLTKPKCLAMSVNRIPKVALQNSLLGGSSKFPKYFEEDTMNYLIIMCVERQMLSKSVIVYH